MPSRIELATTLFDEMAENLATIHPGLQGLMKCPLCLGTFDRSALTRDDDNGLTLEHIVPEALGGRKVTLTCRRCNNTDGSALDAHFVRMIKAHNWQDGDGSLLAGRIKVESDYLPMTLSWNKGDNPRVIRILGGKPDVLKTFVASGRSFAQGGTINFTLNFDYNSFKAQRAVVRMGFLVLCHTYGYAYTLSGAANRVRELIKGGGVDELSKFIFRFHNVEERRPMPPIVTVSVGDGRAYLVFFKIDAMRKWYFTALLPSKDIAEDSVLGIISEIGDQLNRDDTFEMNIT